MRSSVSFAVGLWTGGLIVGGVWSVHHYLALDEPASPAPVMATIAAASTAEESRQLRQINAYLAAEKERLTDALSEMSNEELAERRAIRGHRRLRDSAGEPLADRPAAAETFELRDLTQLALRNDPAALDALSSAAANGQLALLRVWQFGRLNETNYLAVTDQVHGLLDQLLAEWNRTGWAESLPIATEAFEEIAVPEAPVPEAEPGPITESTAPESTDSPEP